MKRVVSAAEAKTHLSSLLSRVEHGHERFVIQRRGKPVAMLVSVEDWSAPSELPHHRPARDFSEVLADLAKLPEVPDEVIDQMVKDIYEERHRGLPPRNRRLVVGRRSVLVRHRHPQ